MRGSTSLALKTNHYTVLCCNPQNAARHAGETGHSAKPELFHHKERLAIRLLRGRHATMGFP